MSNGKILTIGGTEVKPGTRATVNLPVADLYTATSLHMPVQVVRGRRDGPTLFVSAAIHGDELNGVEVIRRLLQLKILKSLTGTLLAVPVVNVHGFLDQSRYLPDRRDLNRSFPGSSKGSIAARLANTFMREIVLQADYGLDLHTGALDRSNLPQIRANIDDPAVLSLAKAFGAPVVIGASMRDGSLRACAAAKGIPLLVYEAGEALRFDEVAIRAGLRGVMRVMRSIGMLPEGKSRKESRPVIATRTGWVRAPSSGIVTQKAALGQRVDEGEQLALVTDPLGERSDPVNATRDGIVIGRSNLPLAHEGDALFNVAAFDSMARAEDVVEAFTNTHNPGLGRTVEPDLLET